MSPASSKVDLDRALLPQVGALGEEYDAWVHRSLKPKGSLRIFESDALESLSHVPWWLVLLVWVPITIALAVLTLTRLDMEPLVFTALAFAGLVLWTLLEYGLHRFIFHFGVKSAFGRRLHFLAHGIHHLDPWDPTRLVFPPVPAMLIALVVFGLLYVVGLLAAPQAALATATALMVGVLVGYMIYDMVHYYTHHARPKSRWGKFLKAYHLAHHHKWPNRMFGVSQPLWDVVFGTARPRR